MKENFIDIQLILPYFSFRPIPSLFSISHTCWLFQLEAQYLTITSKSVFVVLSWFSSFILLLNTCKYPKWTYTRTLGNEYKTNCNSCYTKSCSLTRLLLIFVRFQSCSKPNLKNHFMKYFIPIFSLNPISEWNIFYLTVWKTCFLKTFYSCTAHYYNSQKSNS